VVIKRADLAGIRTAGAKESTTLTVAEAMMNEKSNRYFICNSLKKIRYNE
jgi:hypothetical protein